MDRLTERDPLWLGEEFWTSAREPDDDEIDKVYERLKYYEDLYDHGKLLELPCAVGDTVWYTGSEILPMTIDYFMIFSKEIKIAIKYFGNNEILKNFSTVISDKDIGETVFLTQGEAEKALLCRIRRNDCMD